jgi:MerR family copper efflux transcriptional regulator
VDMAVIVRLNVDVKSIGEVAARFGLPTHVLRHWEAEGLLTPARAGGRRRYTDADLYRVAAIVVSRRRASDSRTSGRCWLPGPHRSAMR